MANNNLDVINIAVHWRNSNAGDILNVYDVRLEGVSGTLSDAAVQSGVEEWLTSLYVDSDLVDAMADSNSHRAFYLYNITQGVPMLDGGRVAALDGNGSGADLPVGVAALVVARTAITRRIGRKYLPPFTVAQLASSEWTSGTMSILASYANQLPVNYITTGGWEIRYVVGHRVGQVYSDVVQAVARNVPAYQRRRKPGIGS